MNTAGETFVNYGDVPGDLIGVSDTSGGNVILNYGTIEGPDESLDVAGGEMITNAGVMEGAITFTGAGTGTANSLTNSGTITGALNSSVNLDIDNAGLWNQAGSAVMLDLGASGGDMFTNAGSIDGAITFTGTGITNTVTNSGGIIGNIKFSRLRRGYARSRLRCEVTARLRGYEVTVTVHSIARGYVRGYGDSALN